MNTQVKRFGNSKGVILPAPIIKLLEIEEFETLELKVEGKNIVLSKVEVFDPQSLDELFENYSGTYDFEIVFDDVKGREIW